MAQPRLAGTLRAAPGAAVIAAPMRLEDSRSILFSYALTFLPGGAVGLGCYLRGVDNRRRRAVADVCQRERLELARELHDFVAHHVTGIVVQAQAARTIRESAPEGMSKSSPYELVTRSQVHKSVTQVRRREPRAI